MSKKVVYAGSEYKSISQLARHLGLSWEQTILRVNRQEDGFMSNADLRAKPIVYDGVQYDSIKSLAEAFGVPYGTAQQRALKGLDPVRHKRKTPTARRGKKTIVDGVAYESLAAALKATGITSSTYERRIKLGLDPFAPPCEKAKPKPVVVRGTNYASIIDFVRAHGSDGDGSNIRKRKRNNPSLSVEDCCEAWLSAREQQNELIKKAKEKRENPQPKPQKPLALKQFYEFTPVCQCPACGKTHAVNRAANHYWAFSKKNIACSEQCKREIAKLKPKTKPKSRDHGKHARRAKRRGAKIEDGITAKSLVLKHGPTCMLCGVETVPHPGGFLPNGATVGHIVALANGGDHTWGNVWVECHACNTKKGVDTLPRNAFKPKENLRSPSPKRS